MPKRPPKIRADQLIVSRGLAETLKKAQALVMTGRVLVTDHRGRERRIDKPGEGLRADLSLRLKGGTRPYVSRAGPKLQAALDAFAIDPAGWVCADFGISTGGFTDCLLRRGAARVYGVDVAYGLVDWRIRTDPRVVLYERTNARHLEAGAFQERVRLAVADVSFISLTVLWPAIFGQLTDDGEVIALVKPQFEAPPSAVVDGLVNDPQVRVDAVDRVVHAARAFGFHEHGRLESPVRGTEGNVEWLLVLRPRGRRHPELHSSSFDRKRE